MTFFPQFCVFDFLVMYRRVHVAVLLAIVGRGCRGLCDDGGGVDGGRVLIEMSLTAYVSCWYGCTVHIESNAIRVHRCNLIDLHYMCVF